MRVSAILLAAALMGGCFSVETAKVPMPASGADEIHVTSVNYGWDLFACLPIVCGNDNFDSWCPFTFFKDEVKSELAMAKVRKVAAEKDMEIRNVQMWTDRDIFFDCYYVVVPWVIQYHETNVSAVLVKRGTK